MACLIKTCSRGWCKTWVPDSERVVLSTCVSAGRSYFPYGKIHVGNMIQGTRSPLFRKSSTILPIVIFLSISPCRRAAISLLLNSMPSVCGGATVAPFSLPFNSRTHLMRSSDVVPPNKLINFTRWSSYRPSLTTAIIFSLQRNL